MNHPARLTDVFASRATILLSRAFLGPFWILQFYFKMRDEKSGSLGLGNLLAWSSGTTADFVATTPLAGWMVRPYTLAVPWAELACGVLILVGWKTRWALVAAAALLVSLDLGLMLQGKHDTVKSNTLILLSLFVALFCERSNRWSLDATRQHAFVTEEGAARPGEP
jgi:thiosulfate dehydrogenase [quinone] large subunit